MHFFSYVFIMFSTALLLRFASLCIALHCFALLASLVCSLLHCALICSALLRRALLFLRFALRHSSPIALELSENPYSPKRQKWETKNTHSWCCAWAIVCTWYYISWIHPTSGKIEINPYRMAAGHGAVYRGCRGGGRRVINAERNARQGPNTIDKAPIEVY